MCFSALGVTVKSIKGKTVLDQTAQQKKKTIIIEINDKSYDVNPGQMLIQVADQHNIYIPRFCYHKKLTVAANCRMCLVDIAGARKPSPACATPITEGMKVYTHSAKTLSYQKAVMEFFTHQSPVRLSNLRSRRRMRTSGFSHGLWPRCLKI